MQNFAAGELGNTQLLYVQYSVQSFVEAHYKLSFNSFVYYFYTKILLCFGVQQEPNIQLILQEMSQPHQNQDRDSSDTMVWPKGPNERGWVQSKNIYITLRTGSTPTSSYIETTHPTSPRLPFRKLYRRTGSAVYCRQIGERLGIRHLNVRRQEGGCCPFSE